MATHIEQSRRNGAAAVTAGGSSDTMREDDDLIMQRERALLRTAIAASLLAAAGAARAEDFPKRTITMVVPFAAGRSTDLIARLLAQKLTEQMGQSVVIKNRAGAGGNVGAAGVVKSAADGYTLLRDHSTHALNPLMAKRSAYDPVKDFEPVALIGSDSQCSGGHQNRSRQHGGRAHRCGEGRFRPSGATRLPASRRRCICRAGCPNSMAGTKLAHVPYRGAGPAMNDLVAGQVPVMFDNLPSSSAEFIKAGTIRALAETTKQRVKQFPDIPTLDEQGLKGYETYSWQAVFAPAKTPKAVVDKLNAEKS